jgi:hypothetical protein
MIARLKGSRSSGHRPRRDSSSLAYAATMFEAYDCTMPAADPFSALTAT